PDQLQQRLAHRRAADLQLLRQVDLQQPGPRRELARHNRLAQTGVGVSRPVQRYAGRLDRGYGHDGSSPSAALGDGGTKRLARNPREPPGWPMYTRRSRYYQEEPLIVNVSGR